MFTLQRLELPKGFNQSFESAPGSEPQITTRRSTWAPGPRCLSLLAALPAESHLARVPFSQGLLET